MTTLDDPRSVADHLIRRLSFYPGDTARLLIAADAVDDLEDRDMRGDALRWAAEYLKRPIKRNKNDWMWFCSSAWSMPRLDEASCHWLPISFSRTGWSVHVFRGTQYWAWGWFIRRFTQVRAEGKI